jgi:uncharacterized protein YjbI with pentapeptide repeats
MNILQYNTKTIRMTRNVMSFTLVLISVNLSGQNIKELKPGCTIQDKNFSEVNLSGTDMYGSQIRNSDFSGAIMVNCRMHHSNMSKVNFSRVNFAYSDLSGIDVGVGSKIIRSNFDGANLEMSDFHQVQMDSCLFTPTTNLTNASFDSCSLRNAIFKGVNLKHTSFEYADLSNAVFIDVTLDSTIFKHANLQGAYFNNITEKQYSLFGNADLTNCNIFNSHFENSAFNSAQLLSSRIENANFKNANIMNATFSGSIIKNCDFSGAVFNPAGALLFDGVDDIVTIESPGSISSANGSFSIELAIVPQNQQRVTGLASFNHRSKNLKNLFEIYLDEKFRMVLQYKISGEKIIHTVISNETLLNDNYNLIFISYNNGDVNFYFDNKKINTKSVYYSFSDEEYKEKTSLTETTYSRKTDETIESCNGNLILGGFSGVYPLAGVIPDSAYPSMAVMYYRFWQQAIDADGKLTQMYPLIKNEAGEQGYPFYYQIEEAPDLYLEGLKNNIFFFNCKDQIIKDTRNSSTIVYKGSQKGEDDQDPLYHIINKNFENTLIENSTMFYGW